MQFDWLNHYKAITNTSRYFWRVENYEKGKTNSHIMKSTFGNKHEEAIKKEIQYWFNACIGAYSEIIIE